MVLPLNLAMTPTEIAAAPVLPAQIAWMACHFCTGSDGISNLPAVLPEGAMLILNDRESCAGHSSDLVAQQLADAVKRFRCESVLLDFQRPWNPESDAMVRTVLKVLPCPAAVTEIYAEGLPCPVFLAPCPPHTPLEKHLQPWRGREVWLEAGLCQERITITGDGTVFTPVFPTESLSGGFYSPQLRCRYTTAVSCDSITFTLFDTPETLKEKLALAHTLGVTRAVGLYQELGIGWG